MNIVFAHKRRGQKKSGEAKRSPESFLKGSCIVSISYHRIFTFEKVYKKSEGNSDHKIVLYAALLSVMCYFCSK